MGFKVLVVDDDCGILETLSDLLTLRGFENETSMSGREALEKLSVSDFDLVLLDLKMPDVDGLEVLREIKKIDKYISVVMMTGYGTIETAVKAMKLGADDYLLKPLGSIDELIVIMRRFEKLSELKNENRFFKEQLDLSFDMSNIIGRSRKMIKLFQLIRKVAPLSSTILIEGESGTGKELIARAIHRNSLRSEKRFVAINCGALPVELLESELFGHEKGAFTGAIRTKRGYFEVADGGTIFLDEISEMSLPLQVKLLRVLQEKKFNRVGGTEEHTSDVRIITSTNRNLEQEVINKRFREDLYYRINVIKISVPPLRDRREDIPYLLNFFLGKYSKEFSKDVKGISPRVLDALVSHSWEGNVRELENVVEYAVAMAEGEEITLFDLPSHVFGAELGLGKSFPYVPFVEAKRIFERNYLENMLIKTKGNMTEASRLTSIPRQNLYNKIRRYGLEPGKYR